MSECADLTCRHDEDEHTTHRCVGMYETEDGSLHPCDCFGFRVDE